MDKIILSNLAFYGYHGVLSEEKVLGQKFFFDIELFLDLTKAGESDYMMDSVSYADVYAVVKDICENNKFDLLEALSHKIAKKILEDFSLIQEIMIRVKKPEAPVNGIFDYFGVEIRRSRDE